MTGVRCKSNINPPYKLHDFKAVFAQRKLTHVLENGILMGGISTVHKLIITTRSHATLCKLFK